MVPWVHCIPSGRSFDGKYGYVFGHRYFELCVNAFWTSMSSFLPSRLLDSQILKEEVEALKRLKTISRLDSLDFQNSELIKFLTVDFI